MRGNNLTNCCPVCGESETKVITEHVTGGKVKQGADVKVLRCEDCDFDFLEIWNDVERANQWYAKDDYVIKPDQFDGPTPKFNNYEVYVNQVEPFLKPDSRVLDVGCGDGQFLSMIRDRVGEVQGVEITPTLLELLGKQGIPVWDKPIQECEPVRPYDIIVMHALLEHIPRISDFLEDLKRFMHDGSMIFFSVPHGLDPLTSYFDVPNYRDHFYREYHFYYFTEKSMGKLLENAGFECELSPHVVASLTNHFHWMHKEKGQSGTAEFTNVILPKPLRREQTPSGRLFSEILDEVDDLYREKLQQAGVGDELYGRMWLAR
jgi:2-polyprenyl-3-methyl-5-hydroxy-6-metoxy-1,4-benzoquinol methylase